MHVLCAYAAAIEAGPLPEAAAASAAEFLELGIGKARSAVTLATRLAADPVPELVLLFGVCGCYRATPEVGDLCLVGTDQLADEGVRAETGFLTMADLGLPDPGPQAMDAHHTAHAARLIRAPIVSGATVSTCSGTDALATERRARTGAVVETMEGAAVALAAAAADVPLVQLRAVSNRTGDRAAAGWDLERACRRVQNGVGQLLESWC